jgi:hypothetical protein
MGKESKNTRRHIPEDICSIVIHLPVLILEAMYSEIENFDKCIFDICYNPWRIQYTQPVAPITSSDGPNPTPLPSPPLHTSL